MTLETTAMFVLLCVTAVPLVWTLFCLFRKPYTPVQWTLYFVNLLLVRVLWRAELPKRLPIPEDQGAVIICNHRSSIDPCFFQVIARRRLIHWMVAQMYGQHTLIGRLLKLTQIIPVERHGIDLSPTKAAIRLAAEGQLVGILPEGRLNTTDQFMLKVRPGAVLVALKSQVPILPCYIQGSPYHDTLWRPLFMPACVQLRVGRLIDLSEYHGREKTRDVVAGLTLYCVKEIAKLAGRDDYKPQLAGRHWKSWQDDGAG